MPRLPIRRKGLSFTAIIGMSFLAILIGFLLGNFMITMMDETGGETQVGVITEEELEQSAEELAEYEEPPALTRETVGEPADDERPEGEDTLYKVQVGAFNERGNAETVKEELEGEGYPVFLTPGVPHRIQVGAFSESQNAEQLVQELREKGYEDVLISR